MQLSKQIYQPKLMVLFWVLIFALIALLFHTKSFQEGFKMLKTTSSVCVVAIFKNEAMVIQEWCNHYFDEGVDHIFLIDNGSTDKFEVELKLFMKRITIIRDQSPHQQEAHYNNYFLEKAKMFNWVIVCDIDEYIYSRLKYPTIKSYLSNVPEDVSLITVGWKMFGSNGYDKQPNSVVESFTKRAKVTRGNQKYERKSIIRGNKLSYIKVHVSKFHGEGNIRELAPGQGGLNLNHYAIMSREYFEKVKMRRGDVARAVNVRDWDYFRRYDTNEVDDYELVEKKLTQMDR